MDDQQRERFQSAVQRKKASAKAASERTTSAEANGDGVHGDEAELVEHGRPQDARDERKKSSGHGKKTADKWNQ